MGAYVLIEAILTILLFHCWKCGKWMLPWTWQCPYIEKGYSNEGDGRCVHTQQSRARSGAFCGGNYPFKNDYDYQQCEGCLERHSSNEGDSDGASAQDINFRCTPLNHRGAFAEFVLTFRKKKTSFLMAGTSVYLNFPFIYFSALSDWCWVWNQVECIAQEH